MSKKAEAKKQFDNIARAKNNFLRVSPRKLNLVAGLIRNMKVEEAVLQLTFSTKRISREVKKVLESAIANAENNYGLDIDRLYVNEVLIGKSTVMKRFRARARGRGARILKPFSRLEIIVSEKEE